MVRWWNDGSTRAAVLLGLLWASPVHACTLDDVDAAISRDTLNHHFPEALDVLARVVDERRAAGRPPSPGLTPTPLHIRGLMALLARLDKQLRTSAGEARIGPVAVLLVESMLWARLPPLPGTGSPDLHVAGPAEGDLVVVTSEDAVRQIVAGQLTIATARAGGMLRLYGAEQRVGDYMAALGDTGRTPAPR